MAHVGILFCLYDHLKQLKEENIMAYMSEEGKITEMIRGLPKQVRKQFVPAPDYAQAC